MMRAAALCAWSAALGFGLPVAIALGLARTALVLAAGPRGAVLPWSA